MNKRPKVNTTMRLDPRLWKAAARLGIDRTKVCEAALQKIMRLSPAAIDKLTVCSRCHSDTVPPELTLSMERNPPQEKLGKFFTAEEAAAVAGQSYMLFRIRCPACFKNLLRKDGSNYQELVQDVSLHESLYYELGEYVSFSAAKVQADAITFPGGIAKPGVVLMTERTAGMVCVEFMDETLQQEYWSKIEEAEKQDGKKAQGWV